MSRKISLTFLGTCSGGGPLPHRACTATSVNLPTQSWLVDCAEGTQLQLLRSRFPKLSRVRKIFITHLHLDHCMGILPLMNSAMRSTNTASEHDTTSLRLEFYGPAGLRRFIRTNLEITHPNITGAYRAHELLAVGEPCTSSADSDRHPHERGGRDIRADRFGLWRDFESDDGFVVSAAPIEHRVPCLGFVFSEISRQEIAPSLLLQLDTIPNLDYPHGGRKHAMQTLLGGQPVTLRSGFVLQPSLLTTPQPRKIVILGDTSDPSTLEGIAKDADVLVHESTNACLPAHIDPRSRNPEFVRAKAISRGHSTPDMAGEFARRIGARMLFLNHFSARFPDGRAMNNRMEMSTSSKAQNEDTNRLDALLEIEKQASKAWGMGNAVCARDFLNVDIPLRRADSVDYNWNRT